MIKQAILANTPELAQQALRECGQARVEFFDVETSGLDWKRNHIVGYVLKAISSPNSYYVPVRHLGGGNLPGCKVPATADGWKGDLHWFEVELAKVVRLSADKRWVGHYLGFDLKMAAKHGIFLLGDYEDTWINAALCDENQGTFSLDAVARWLEVTAKKGDDLYQYIMDTFDVKYQYARDSMEHFWRTDASHPLVYEYAAGDDITTEEVWERQQIILDEEDLRRVHEVECKLIRTIFRMTLRGVRIDEDELDRCHQHFDDEVKKLEAKFPAGFKSNAPTHLKAYLSDYIDGGRWPCHPPTVAEIKRAEKEGRPPRGAPIFNEKQLEKVPEGQAILDLRKMRHAQSSFTVPMKERHLFKGRVHCEFNQLKRDDYGTVTGRLSSSDPNLQQVPKRNKKISKPYRKIFLPEEGHYWDTNDFKQQEYVVFTEYSRDERLVAGYSATPILDIHQIVADMFGRERDPFGKRMNLGILYGMGKDALAGHLGVDVQTAQEYKRRYLEMFPSGPGFLKAAERRAKQRGFVRTFLGRRRRFRHTDAHKAGNAIIQGGSADITKLKMVEVDDFFESEGDEAHLMLQVHDALDFSIPIGREELATEARRIMTAFGPEDRITLIVPLGVDSGTGPNWSVATYGA